MCTVAGPSEITMIAALISVPIGLAPIGAVLLEREGKMPRPAAIVGCGLALALTLAFVASAPQDDDPSPSSQERRPFYPGLPVLFGVATFAAAFRRYPWALGFAAAGWALAMGLIAHSYAHGIEDCVWRMMPPTPR